MLRWEEASLLDEDRDPYLYCCCSMLGASLRLAATVAFVVAAL